MPMSRIETLRNEARELRNEAARLISLAENKELEARTIEQQLQKTQLVTQLTQALSNLTVEQLGSLITTLQNGEQPTVAPTPTVVANEQQVVPTVNPAETMTVETPTPVVENPTITPTPTVNSTETVAVETPTPTTTTTTQPIQWIDAEDVTEDMLTPEMHQAQITLVGPSHQDLQRIHNRVVAVGDRITLRKRNDVPTQNTVGYTQDDISVAILPASDEKFAQLHRIGARSISNRDVQSLDHEIFDTDYIVVGVIPGAFVFLNPITDNIAVDEVVTSPTTSEQPSIDPINMDILNGVASTVQEAQSLFEAQKPAHCRIDNINEIENGFMIEYINHRANTMANMRNETFVRKATQ